VVILAISVTNLGEAKCLNLCTVKMPQFAAIFEESFRAKRLATASAHTALWVEVLVCSIEVPSSDGLAALRATRHVLSVALGAERQTVVILEELGEGEQTLAAPVALEALLVEPLAEGHDCIALVGDVLVAQSANEASLLGSMSDHLHTVGKGCNLVTGLQRLTH